MTKLLLPVLGAFALGLTTGCQHPVYQIRHTPGELPPPPPPADQTSRLPRASVTASPADAGASALSASLKTSVEGSLAARGFEVVSKGKPDRVVSLSVSRVEAASLAEWRVYEGRVVTRVKDGATGALLAGTTLAAKGERGLGAAQAEANLATRLSAQVNEWLAKSLPAYRIALPTPPPPPPPDAAVALLTLAPASPGLTQEQVLSSRRDFLQAVSARTGILSCRLVREDPRLRAATFRVEYRTSLFPGGLLNTLVLERPLGPDVELEIVH